MRKIITILAFMAISFVAAAQSTTAKLYLIREGMHEGSAVACSMFVNDSLICKLNNKRYSIHEVAPGESVFHVQWSGKTPGKDKRGDITLNLEAGKTYYVKFNPVMKAFNGYVGLIEVTENTFKSVKESLKIDEECD